MGFGYCRKLLCREKADIDYFVKVKHDGKDLVLCICGMWKHYATKHQFQPSELERKMVIEGEPYGYKSLDPIDKRCSELRDITVEPIDVMFVERKGLFFTHKKSSSPDQEWINKLSEMLDTYGWYMCCRG